jgi:hypothetical protein
VEIGDMWKKSPRIKEVDEWEKFEIVIFGYTVIVLYD